MKTLVASLALLLAGCCDQTPIIPVDLPDMVAVPDTAPRDAIVCVADGAACNALSVCCGARSICGLVIDNICSSPTD